MRYIKMTENRKELVKRLEELTRKKAVYTRMPECAFVVGDYKVEKDGTLVVAEGADMDLIEDLIADGMIRALSSSSTTTNHEGEQLATAAQESEADTQEEEESEEEPDTTVEEESEDGEEPATQSEEEGAVEEEGVVEEGEVEVEAAVEEEAVAETEPGTVITFPLATHGTMSLRNLVNMVCSRGPLISKATGGDFSCTYSLAEALADIDDMKSFLVTLKEHEGELHGLEINEGVIRFSGFPDDPEKAEAFTHLATLMDKMALESKRLLARPVADENEKYIFRIWLLRLGMEGKKYAQTRKILLEPLAGNTAFKDKAMEDRWKEKRKAAATDGPSSEAGSDQGLSS